MTMSIFDSFARLFSGRTALLFFACAGCACGMAEDEQEDRDRRIYLTFADDAFAAYCLDAFDTNGDGRLSRYEAQRVREMDCSGRGIALLDELDEFVRLVQLDCSDNRLVRLDATACTLLETLDCADNRLSQLDLAGLRSLRTLAVRGNALDRLDLQSNASLAELDLRGNRLSILDVSPCAASLHADVRDNPRLETVYYRRGQQIAVSDPARLVERP